MYNCLFIKITGDQMKIQAVCGFCVQMKDYLTGGKILL